uniref:Putative ovule protein n=1 Tax=Solanum chacoense TaxID=4108 RepID=A0A0V0IC55_SOLCH
MLTQLLYSTCEFLVSIDYGELLYSSLEHLILATCRHIQKCPSKRNFFVFLHYDLNSGFGYILN